MPISSLQQPSTRREALRDSIEAAVSDGDSHRIRVLSCQWVHRYGLLSLPDAATAETQRISPSTPQQTTAAFAPITPLHSKPADQDQEINALTEQDMPEVGAERPEMPWTSEAEALSGSSEPLDADRNDLPGSDPGGLPALQQVFDQQDSPSPLPLRSARAATPPPLSTPRSLRRWLPGTDTLIPQAS